MRRQLKLPIEGEFFRNEPACYLTPVGAADAALVYSLQNQLTKLVIEHNRRTAAKYFESRQVSRTAAGAGWRMENGPGKEVLFTQDHALGKVPAMARIDMGGGGVTVRCRDLKCELCHAVPACSNWK